MSPPQNINPTDFRVAEFIATIGLKGQLTIPTEIRHKFNLHPKDKVILRMHENRVEIEPGVMTLEEAMGSVIPLHPDQSLEEHIKEAKAERISKVISTLL